MELLRFFAKFVPLNTVAGNFRRPAKKFFGQFSENDVFFPDFIENSFAEIVFLPRTMQIKTPKTKNFCSNRKKIQGATFFQKFMLSFKIFFSKQVNRSKGITIQKFIEQCDKKSKTLGVFQKRLLKLFF